MNKRITIGLSVVALCAAAGGAAFAAERTAEQMAREAQADAAKASRAVAGHDAAAAVRWAEAAVALAPRDAGYRFLLGQAYLSSGRFASARAAFGDSLSLSPGDGRVALNLALAQIADGDWTAARQTLDAHSGSISVSDRGLAIALAGDPGGAVDLMLPVARQPGADAKLRQNLALALALAGRWQDSRLIAGMDLSPAEADKRLEQWAAFARPTGHADQVATLLGVTPVSDPGQPVALALNAAAPVAVAAADPVQPAAMPQPVVAAVAAPMPAAPASVVATAGAPHVVFGPRTEVVQPLPVKAVVGAKPVVAPVKTRIVTPVAVAKPTPGAPQAKVGPVPGRGKFFVQLGAYDSVGIARDDWARASRRFSGFAGHVPQGMPFSANGKNYFRLSVGGFDEAGAKRLCVQYRAKGGKCFVRTGAGEKAVNWEK